MAKCSWCNVEKLGEGVYAVIDKDGGWFLSNTGLVDMGRFTLVIDTQYNASRAKDVLDVIGDLGLPKPGLILNTHHHGDHAWGNHVFGVPAIMHREAARMVELLMGLVPAMYAPFFPDLDFTSSKYTKPDIVIGDNGVELQADKGSIKVYYLGPAHTPGDIIAVVDWADVVFAGDLVFNEVTPLAIDGTIQGWIRTLNELERLASDKKIVGGHGPVANVEVIGVIRDYLKHVLEGTRQLLEEGITDPLSIARRIGPGPIKGWKNEERLVLNVARAIMGIHGRPPGEIPPDLPELARKMMEYRGQ
jgi:cyclase